MTTRLGIGLASIGLGVLLTACGGDSFTDLSGEEMADASKDAMKGLDAVKVSGTIKNDGNEVSLDIQTNDKGECTGSVGIGGGKAEILGADGSIWFKPDEAFWRTSASSAADQIIGVVGDKWVVAPNGGDGFDEFCDIDKLLDQMLSTGKDDSSTYEKGDAKKIDGVEAVPISHEGDNGSSIGYVRVDDPHYLVKIEKTDGEDGGAVTFSEFNEKVDVEAPAPDDVIDLDNLAG